MESSILILWCIISQTHYKNLHVVQNSFILIELEVTQSKELNVPQPRNQKAQVFVRENENVEELVQFVTQAKLKKTEITLDKLIRICYVKPEDVRWKNVVG